MFKHYLKISVRSIINDYKYSIYNVIGLALALSCCLLLLFWIKNELSYEDCYPNSDRIYHILEIEERQSKKHYNDWIRNISTPLKEQFPQIVAATCVYSEILPFSIMGEEVKEGIIVNYATASPDYLKMFAFEYTEGSPQTVIENGGGIITKELAHKFFGSASALGQTITYGNQLFITIDAVVELPQNTDIKFDILDVHRESGKGKSYIMLEKNVKITHEFEEKITHFLSSTYGSKNTLSLQAIKDVHLHSPGNLATGRLTLLISSSIAVFLILTTAIVSYVNTSVARALGRLKEIGVRKITGGKQYQLMLRFLCEYFIITCFAVFVAMIATTTLFPYFSEILGSPLKLDFDFSTIIIIFVTCLTVTLLSGGYSAFYLSSFKPLLAFRGGSVTGAKENFRKILIGIQFFITISVLTCTVFIYKQLHMMTTSDTGVKKDNILIIRTDLWYGVQDFFDILKKENPNIIDATIATSPPYNAEHNYSNISWEGSDENIKNFEFSQIYCDHNYANVFDLEIIQGEFISPGLTWWGDAKPESFNIVINESFKELMNEDNPIGITVHYSMGEGEIIGVVKDFNFKPLKEKISPLIISFNPEFANSVFIKITENNTETTMKYIFDKYNEMKPENMPLIYDWVKSDYKKMYDTEIKISVTLIIFTVISLILSLMGISSMISFMIEKRAKELAIRKINGAKILDIAKLFITDILKVGFFASILSILICYIILNRWIEEYMYRISLSWWLFLLVPSFIFVLSSILIGAQVFFTARQHPTQLLKSE